MRHSRVSRQVGPLLAAAALMLSASPSAGQDQPAAFVHGFNSDGASWQAAASQLASDLRIQAYTPTLSWNQSYATQAGQLATAMTGVGPNIITAGHSNGAIVSRFLNRDHGAPNNRIVSVGTPHLGTGLAYSALNGELFSWGARVANRIAIPLDHYSYWELQAGVDSPWDHAWYALDHVGGFFSIVGNLFATLGFVSPGLGAPVPVLPEMVYNSTSLNALNGTANLSRESSAMFARVGISVTTDSPEDLVFRVVDPLLPGSADDFAFWKDFAAIAAWAAYFHYLDYPILAPYSHQLRSYRYMWYDLAMELDHVDVNYLQLMGGLASYSSAGSYSWYPNDGVVRTASQAYPGGTRQVLIQGGPLHMEQKQNPDVIDEIEFAFVNDFGVPSRTQYPPPSPPVLTAVMEQAGPAQRPRLTWNAVPSATSYRVYRRLSQGGVEWNWVLWREVTTTTFLDETVVSQYLGVGPGVSGDFVGYHVSAVGASGESAPSQDHFFRPNGIAPQRAGGGDRLAGQQR